MAGAREVIAARLRDDYASEYETNEPPSAWHPQAEAILRDLLAAGYKVVPLAGTTRHKLGGVKAQPRA